MGFCQILIFAITVIVLSQSRHVLSTSLSFKDAEFSRIFHEKIEASCSPDLNKRSYACEEKANEYYNYPQDPAGEITVAQRCRRRDYVVACRRAVFESCKSQLAHVYNEIMQGWNENWFRVQFDCRRLRRNPESNSKA